MAHVGLSTGSYPQLLSFSPRSWTKFSMDCPGKLGFCHVCWPFFRWWLDCTPQQKVFNIQNLRFSILFHGKKQFRCFHIFRKSKHSDEFPQRTSAVWLQVYPPAAHQFVSRPDLVVDLENFATGEKHLLGTVTLWDRIAGTEKISASKVYVGEFSQSLTSFEMSCYPFDYKEVFFRIGLQILGKTLGTWKRRGIPNILLGRVSYTRCLHSAYSAIGQNCLFFWEHYI